MSEHSSSLPTASSTSVYGHLLFNTHESPPQAQLIAYPFYYLMLHELVFDWLMSVSSTQRRQRIARRILTNVFSTRQALAFKKEHHKLAEQHMSVSAVLQSSLDFFTLVVPVVDDKRAATTAAAATEQPGGEKRRRHSPHASVGNNASELMTIELKEPMRYFDEQASAQNATTGWWYKRWLVALVLDMVRSLGGDSAAQEPVWSACLPIICASSDDDDDADNGTVRLCERLLLSLVLNMSMGNTATTAAALNKSTVSRRAIGEYLSKVFTYASNNNKGNTCVDRDEWRRVVTLLLDCVELVRVHSIRRTSMATFWLDSANVAECGEFWRSFDFLHVAQACQLVHRYYESMLYLDVWHNEQV